MAIPPSKQPSVATLVRPAPRCRNIYKHCPRAQLTRTTFFGHVMSISERRNQFIELELSFTARSISFPLRAPQPRVIGCALSLSGRASRRARAERLARRNRGHRKMIDRPESCRNLLRECVAARGELVIFSNRCQGQVLTLSASLREKLLSQWAHGYGLTARCIRLCRLRS